MIGKISINGVVYSALCAKNKGKKTVRINKNWRGRETGRKKVMIK